MALGSTCGIHGAESILPLHGEEVWSAVVQLRRSKLRRKVRNLIHWDGGYCLAKKSCLKFFIIMH
jgi:hypothetical protein